MTVKFIAAFGYVATWGVIVLGVFRGLPLGVWFMTLVMVFLGSIAAWNALPTAPAATGRPTAPAPAPEAAGAPVQPVAEQAQVQPRRGGIPLERDE